MFWHRILGFPRGSGYRSRPALCRQTSGVWTLALSSSFDYPFPAEIGRDEGYLLAYYARTYLFHKQSPRPKDTPLR